MRREIIRDFSFHSINKEKSVAVLVTDSNREDLHVAYPNFTGYSSGYGGGIGGGYRTNYLGRPHGYRGYGYSSYRK